MTSENVPSSDLPDDPVSTADRDQTQHIRASRETASGSYCSFRRRCRRMSALIHVLTEHTRTVFHTNPLIDRRSFGAVSMDNGARVTSDLQPGGRALQPIAMNFLFIAINMTNIKFKPSI